MKKLASIFGYSGHSYVVIEALELLGWQLKGYYELNKKVNNPFSLDYLGTEDDCVPPKNESDKFGFVGIGNNKIRSKISSKILKLGYELPNILHPDSKVSKHVRMGQGNFFARGAMVNPLTDFGDNIIVNTGASIDHECEIDSFTHIAPGAVLAGNVKVGKGSFIGANSVIKQGIEIGENCIVGAGSVVISSVKSNQKVVGVPARPKKSL